MGACGAAHCAGQRGGNRRHVVVREVVNGLMYILSTGCRCLGDPWGPAARSTLYDYFDLWGWDGTLDRIQPRFMRSAAKPPRARRARPPRSSTARASRARKKGACD